MSLGTAIVVIAPLLYIALYLVFFPRSYSTMDESNYFNMAYVVRHGTLYPDVAGLRFTSTYPVGPHMVSKYPPGMPALLAVVSFVGWKAALGANLIVHLLAYYVLILMLRHLKAPAPFAVLYLFHPTAVLYSRTVMADPASGLFIALMAYQFFRRRYALSGLCAGLAVLLRMGNAVALLLLLVAPFAQAGDSGLPFWKSWAEFQTRATVSLKILLGAALPVALAAYYAIVIANGEMGRYTGVFAVRYIPSMLPYYCLGLLIIYPAMLLAPFLYRGPYRFLLGSVCLTILLMYSAWFYRDQGASAIESLILGQRYFLASMPLWIALYSCVVWDRVKSWNGKVLTAIMATTCLLLGATAVGIHIKHQRYLARLAQVRDSLVQTVGPGDYLLCNTQIAKLFHPGLGTCDFDNLSGVYKENVDQFRQRISTTIATGNHRAFIATWLREARKDDETESALVPALLKGFTVREDASVRPANLPDDVRLIELKPPAQATAR